jgi:hypothetical protein
MWWPHPLSIAATIALTLAAGITVGRLLPPPREMPREARAIAQAADATGARRQLQFATPGGTRVIWVFDPEFKP